VRRRTCRSAFRFWRKAISDLRPFAAPVSAHRDRTRLRSRRLLRPPLTCPTSGSVRIRHGVGVELLTGSPRSSSAELMYPGMRHQGGRAGLQTRPLHASDAMRLVELSVTPPLGPPRCRIRWWSGFAGARGWRQPGWPPACPAERPSLRGLLGSGPGFTRWRGPRIARVGGETRGSARRGPPVHRRRRSRRGPLNSARRRRSEGVVVGRGPA
jgi:hypothetical protein